MSEHLHELFRFCPRKKILVIFSVHNHLIVFRESFCRTGNQKRLCPDNPVLYRICFRLLFASFHGTLVQIRKTGIRLKILPRIHLP